MACSGCNSYRKICLPSACSHDASLHEYYHECLNAYGQKICGYTEGCC